ncbi:hypothetical protein JL720_11438 [Aureococcus anophagefferens]|nr:hypothetical protein JL720_11438 [Aureococcus anophagefferens]
MNRWSGFSMDTIVGPCEATRFGCVEAARVNDGSARRGVNLAAKKSRVGHGEGLTALRAALPIGAMEQGSNLSKEQLLAYIKKQKKAIAALTEDKAAKQVIIEDLKNEFASLEPKLRNRVAQLQEENDALRSADAPADAPAADAAARLEAAEAAAPTRREARRRPGRRRRPARVELGRARDAALAEAEAARRAALDADARAAKKQAEDAVAAAARDRDGALDDRDGAATPRPNPQGVADALEAAKAGAKAALETMRVEGDAARAEAVAAAVQAFAKKRDEAAKAFEDAPADGRLEAAEEKVKKLQVYSSAVATLERHLKRERDLRTSEDASDNGLFLKNSVVRFLCAKDDKEMQDMLGAMASILSLAPHEVEAIEAAAAKPGLVSRILDAEIRVPFFGR